MKKTIGLVAWVLVTLTVITRGEIRADELSHSRPRIIPRHQIQSSSVARVTSKYQIMSRLHNVKSRGFRNKELILVGY